MIALNGNLCFPSLEIPDIIRKPVEPRIFSSEELLEVVFGGRSECQQHCLLKPGATPMTSFSKKSTATEADGRRQDDGFRDA